MIKFNATSNRLLCDIFTWGHLYTVGNFWVFDIVEADYKKKKKDIVEASVTFR